MNTSLLLKFATGAAVGALLGGAETALAARVGIGDDFVRDVEAMMKPGTSVLFVLDDEGDMDVILHAIRGLGGTVLKTNVDVERARLIQATLAGSPARRARPRSRFPGPSPRRRAGRIGPGTGRRETASSRL